MSTCNNNPRNSTALPQCNCTGRSRFATLLSTQHTHESDTTSRVRGKLTEYQLQQQATRREVQWDEVDGSGVGVSATESIT